MAVEYSNIIPIRFTNAQLAQVDQVAAQFKIKRSTLIRQQLLSALSQSMEKPPANLSRATGGFFTF